MTSALKLTSEKDSQTLALINELNLSMLTEEQQAVFKEVWEKVVAVRPEVVRMLGGDGNAAILLCQYFYYHSISRTQDRSFYNTFLILEERTGLSQYFLERARKKLIGAGYVIEESRGLPRKIWMRLDLAKIAEDLRVTLKQFAPKKQKIESKKNKRQNAKKAENPVATPVSDSKISPEIHPTQEKPVISESETLKRIQTSSMLKEDLKDNSGSASTSPKKEKKQTIPRERLDAMTAELYQYTIGRGPVNFQILGTAMKVRLGRVSHQLCTANYEPGHLGKIFEFLKKEFRFRDAVTVTPEIIMDYAPRWLLSQPEMKTGNSALTQNSGGLKNDLGGPAPTLYDGRTLAQWRKNIMVVNALNELYRMDLDEWWWPEDISSVPRGPVGHILNGGCKDWFALYMAHKEDLQSSTKV